MLCTYLLIYYDIKVFVRAIFFISLKFCVFNSICLELRLAQFAIYYAFLSRCSARAVTIGLVYSLFRYRFIEEKYIHRLLYVAYSI